MCIVQTAYCRPTSVYPARALFTCCVKVPLSVHLLCRVSPEFGAYCASIESCRQIGGPALLTMVALHLKPLSNIRRLRHDQLLMVLKSAVCLSHARHEDTRLRILGLGALLSMSADIRQSFILCLIQELLRSAHGQLTGHMCSLLLSVAAELIT